MVRISIGLYNFTSAIMALSLSQLQIPHQEVSCNPPREETDVSESNEQPTTPAVFTKFPDLPPELRLKIWNLMLPGSRVVHLRFEEPGRIFLSPSLPVTLQINRESRKLLSLGLIGLFNIVAKYLRYRT